MQLNSKLKVVVTGANGQLGHQLVQKLQNQVHLAAFDRASLNITDDTHLQNVLNVFAPDVIINAAAYTAVDKAELEPALAAAVNTKASAELAKIARSLDAVLIHVSTDYVFDGLQDKPYDETDNTNPQSTYGATKLAGELAIIENCKKHIILRTAWVFAEHGHNFVKTMLRLAQNRSELGVVADQLGGPTYAGDIANAIIRIISQLHIENETRYGIYHFSGMPYVSWHQFASQIFTEALAQHVIDKAPIVNAISTAQYPTPARRPAFSTLDCSKIQRNFGIFPSDWQAALKDLALYR